jgi:hypothetical protein
MLSRLGPLIGLGFAVSLASGACAAKAAAIGTRVTICGNSIAVPQIQPPVGSGPVVLMAVPCFEGQAGRASNIPQAYQRYVQLQPSRPEAGVWIPYDAAARAAMEADFRRLAETGKFGELSIAVAEYTFPNGVVGKFITYTAHER